MPKTDFRLHSRSEVSRTAKVSSIKSRRSWSGRWTRPLLSYLDLDAAYGPWAPTLMAAVGW